MNKLAEFFRLSLDILVTFNNDLKKGNVQQLQLETTHLISHFEVELQKYFKIVRSPSYGTNIEFIGINSTFLFPAVLFINNFRMEILKDLRLFIKHDFTPDQFALFLSKKIVSTIGFKRGGFDKQSIELMRFYLQWFTKLKSQSYSSYKPHLSSYKYKYYKLTQKNCKQNFYKIHKYISLNYIPKCNYFSLLALFIDYDQQRHLIEDIHGNLLGMLYNNAKEKKFLLLHIHPTSIKGMRPFLIREISFFENLDLFYNKESQSKLRNKVNDILYLYNDYKDNSFGDSSIESKINFESTINQSNEKNYEKELINHIFNTNKLPSGSEYHPELQKCYGLRNSVVRLFGSTHYLIQIFDPQQKKIDRFWEIFDLLLKNTFSNGFIIHYRSGLFISTHAFQEDFEPVRQNLLEFFWSFKLECHIYENLNYVPFSFYRLPPSNYYSAETQSWNFPLFEDKPVEYYFDHLARNYRLEASRLEDLSFKTKIDVTLNQLQTEIKTIKKNQPNKS